MKPKRLFNNGLPLTLTLWLVLSLASCVGTGTSTVVPLERQKHNLLYCANSLNMPALEKKGTGRVNFAGSLGNNQDTHNGFEFQSAYAPGSHIGLTLDGILAQRKNDEGGRNNVTLNLDAGIGYISRLDKNFSIGLYAGAGTGHTKNQHYTGYSQINYHKLFLLPTIGYTSLNKKFNMGVGLRFSSVTFHIQQGIFDTTREAFTADNFLQLQSSPKRFFLEPAFVIRYGWPDFQFQFQYNRLVQTSSKHLNMGEVRWQLGFSIPLFPVVKQ